MVSFDPYLNWLGIPPHEQPPNFYRLLGVILFESNPEVIQQAADRQSLRVGAYQAGPQGEMCQQLLSEIAMAQFCLLDPQQKAAYDGQLCESLAQRGECSVVAPPPPAGAGRVPVAGAAIGAAAAGVGPMSPMGPIGPMGAGSARADVASLAAMSMPSSPPPVVQMPPTMRSAPPGFVPAMPQPFPPATMPVAVPFPAAAAAPAAPPATPPAAPQRPLDELESLTSQPTTRRHILKKKNKDYTTQIIIGSVVTVAGILLFIVYAAVKSQDPSEHGLGGVVPDKPVESVAAKLAAAHKQKEKEIAKEKEKKEKEKQAAADHAATRSTGHPGDGKISPLRSHDEDVRRPNPDPQAGVLQSADDAGPPLATPYKFGPPTRTMDSPEPGGHVDTAPQPEGRDTPQGLGGDNDPVMETPKDP